MNIKATIGNESHTTSKGWAKLAINGQRVYARNAKSAEWLTDYGDKHASWSECIFEVQPGDKIEWTAGKNSGNRGMNKVRQNFIFEADPSAPLCRTEDLGYPASNAGLEGRLRLIADKDQKKANRHQELAANL